MAPIDLSAIQIPGGYVPDSRIEDHLLKWSESTRRVKEREMRAALAKLLPERLPAFIRESKSMHGMHRIATRAEFQKFFGWTGSDEMLDKALARVHETGTILRIAYSRRDADGIARIYGLHFLRLDYEGSGFLHDLRACPVREMEARYHVLSSKLRALTNHGVDVPRGQVLVEQMLALVQRARWRIMDSWQDAWSCTEPLGK